MNILLVAGGWSPEREISLIGARAIQKALTDRGHSVTQYDLSDGLGPLLDLAVNHDAAFLNLHGAPGEDGLVQALLDRVGCPYQGSGPAGSFIALHKSAAKALFRKAGIGTPDWIYLPTPPPEDWQPHLSYPLFVKSDTGGSSLHLYKVNNRTELQQALDSLFALGQEVLIEPLIRGREATCGVLERGGKTEALPPVLIVPQHEFFDYHDKYTDAGECEICPAPLPEDVLNSIRETALQAHACLGLRGYSRTDLILTDEGRIQVLEVNTLPGMTPASLVPREAAVLGMEFGELLETLLKEAVARRK